MPDYIFLMHKDATSGGDWEAYVKRLGKAFEGGSAIGDGVCVRKGGPIPGLSGHLGGYIRVTAASLEEATSLLAGNPHFEAGGTVEIRELPES